MKSQKISQLFPKLLFVLLGVIMLINTSYSKDIVVNGSRIERSLLEMYEEDDLGACCLFKGDFINFGYWKDIPYDGSFTEKQRAESSKALYNLVAQSINISIPDTVLEIGCGKGAGACFIFEKFKPQTMQGMDFSGAQIQRALKTNCKLIQDEKRLSFHCGSAEDIPFKSSSFDKVISVEAAQHFDDLEAFSLESHRVLKPGGKLAIAAFFATSSDSYQPVSSMVQTVQDGIDKMNVIDDVKQILEKAGYINVRIESIGVNVWSSFDQWVSQTELKDSWTRNWYIGYQRNLLDYYLITADKSIDFYSAASEINKNM